MKIFIHVNFMYSEKGTRFDKISKFYLKLPKILLKLYCPKSKRKFGRISVLANKMSQIKKMNTNIIIHTN